jgi:hypothetical protein
MATEFDRARSTLDIQGILSKDALSGDLASLPPRWNNRTIEMIHELGADLIGDAITRRLVIEPSATRTVVHVESRVVTDTAARMNSPAYLATVRRRRCRKIGKLVAALAKKSRRDDFAAFTFKVVDEIRGLLSELTDVESEGNTREILRQIRDTFLDGGHDRYRDSKARDLVADIFERLSQFEEVSCDDVDEVWDELNESGIAAALPQLFVVGQGNTEPDGE